MGAKKWTYKDCRFPVGSHSIFNEAGKLIAEVYSKEDVPLITSAPALLKALEGIITAFWNEEPKDFHQRRGSYYDAIKKQYEQQIDLAEQAIKKATGQ